MCEHCKQIKFTNWRAVQPILFSHKVQHCIKIFPYLFNNKIKLLTYLGSHVLNNMLAVFPHDKTLDKQLSYLIHHNLEAWTSISHLLCEIPFELHIQKRKFCNDHGHLSNGNHRIILEYCAVKTLWTFCRKFCFHFGTLYIWTTKLETYITHITHISCREHRLPPHMTLHSKQNNFPNKMFMCDMTSTNFHQQIESGHDNFTNYAWKIVRQYIRYRVTNIKYWNMKINYAL